MRKLLAVVMIVVFGIAVASTSASARPNPHITQYKASSGPSYLDRHK